MTVIALEVLWLFILFNLLKENTLYIYVRIFFPKKIKKRRDLNGFEPGYPRSVGRHAAARLRRQTALIFCKNRRVDLMPRSSGGKELRLGTKR